jgi:hypothetical protein
MYREGKDRFSVMKMRIGSGRSDARHTHTGSLIDAARRTNLAQKLIFRISAFYPPCASDSPEYPPPRTLHIIPAKKCLDLLDSFDITTRPSGSSHQPWRRNPSIDQFYPFSIPEHVSSFSAKRPSRPAQGSLPFRMPIRCRCPGRRGRQSRV